MQAYKGFNNDLTATMGKGTYQFHPGETVREDQSKCARTGFHCTENPLDCLHYYGLCSDNRYFLVEAAGDINEDGTDTRIACTDLALVRELTVKELAMHGVMYMVQHPVREWEQDRTHLKVKPEQAEAVRKGAIAIARGRDPRVRGAAGAVLGLLKEPETGWFEAAKVFEVSGGIKPDTWYHLKEGKLEEAL